MTRGKELFHVHLIEKASQEESYHSAHRHEKSAHKVGERVVRQKSPKKFTYLVKYY